MYMTKMINGFLHIGKLKLKFEYLINTSNREKRFPVSLNMTHIACCP